MRVNTPVTQVEVEFSDSANILSTTNLKGAITYINDDFIKISGFDKEELIGKSHNIVRHPDMPPAAFAMMWSNLKSGKSWMGMVKNRCKNGNHYWVDAFATPVEENGAIREYQSVRRKPKKEYVRRAEAIYPQLKLGKTPPELKQPKLSFQLKLLSASLAPFTLFSLIALTLKNPIYQAIILLTGILIAAFSLKASMKPLSTLFTRAKFLIDDPVAQYVYTERNDEIGQVLLALKALESETAALIGRVAESANTMGAQSASLRESVELSTVHAGKQFTETDQVAAAINEMTSSIQEVSKSAQRSSEAANSGLEESEKGKKVVDTTVGLLEVLMQEMNTAASTIKKLENSSNSIAVVLNVINDIAEQTNLLALNAAIEAARAGDAGRGFAVVADEVRTLANRTRASTGEIRDVVTLLQQDSADAVSAMNEGLKKAQACLNHGNITVESFDSILSAIQKINDMCMQIAAAVEEQSTVAEEISRSIHNIRDLSEENVKGSKESAVVSDDLVNVSIAFTVLANQFWSKQTNRA